MKDKLRFLIQTYIEAKDRDVHDINKFVEEVDKLYRGTLMSIVKRVENYAVISHILQVSAPHMSDSQYKDTWTALKEYIIEGK